MALFLCFKDFQAGIADFHNRACAVSDLTPWLDLRLIQVPNGSFLRVTQATTIAGPTRIAQKLDISENEIPPIEEIDTERIHSAGAANSDRDEHGNDSIRVIYDVVFSVSFQVPVLYMQFADVKPGLYDSGSVVSDTIIPSLYQPQVQNSGVMGAMTLTMHPYSELPAYFVHPCNTANAMHSVCPDGDVEPVDYLLKWMGLVGASIGLKVPIDLVLSHKAEHGRCFVDPNSQS